VTEIVTDAEQLLDLVRGTASDLGKVTLEDKEAVAAAQVLTRMLGQDIEQDENGTPPEARRGTRSVDLHP
jgi:hypothetical protein